MRNTSSPLLLFVQIIALAVDILPTSTSERLRRQTSYSDDVINIIDPISAFQNRTGIVNGDDGKEGNSTSITEEISSVSGNISLSFDVPKQEIMISSVKTKMFAVPIEPSGYEGFVIVEVASTASKNVSEADSILNSLHLGNETFTVTETNLSSTNRPIAADEVEILLNSTEPNGRKKNSSEVTEKNFSVTNATVNDWEIGKGAEIPGNQTTNNESISGNLTDELKLFTEHSGQKIVLENATIGNTTLFDAKPSNEEVSRENFETESYTASFNSSETDLASSDEEDSEYGGDTFTEQSTVVTKVFVLQNATEKEHKSYVNRGNESHSAATKSDTNTEESSKVESSPAEANDANVTEADRATTLTSDFALRTGISGNDAASVASDYRQKIGEATKKNKNLTNFTEIAQSIDVDADESEKENDQLPTAKEMNELFSGNHTQLTNETDHDNITDTAQNSSKEVGVVVNENNENHQHSTTFDSSKILTKKKTLKKRNRCDVSDDGGFFTVQESDDGKSADEKTDPKASRENTDRLETEVHPASIKTELSITSTLSTEMLMDNELTMKSVASEASDSSAKLTTKSYSPIDQNNPYNIDDGATTTEGWRAVTSSPLSNASVMLMNADEEGENRTEKAAFSNNDVLAINRPARSDVMTNMKFMCKMLDLQGEMDSMHGCLKAVDEMMHENEKQPSSSSENDAKSQRKDSKMNVNETERRATTNDFVDKKTKGLALHDDKQTQRETSGNFSLHNAKPSPTIERKSAQSQTSAAKTSNSTGQGDKKLDPAGKSVVTVSPTLGRDDSIDYAGLQEHFYKVIILLDEPPKNTEQKAKKAP